MIKKSFFILFLCLFYSLNSEVFEIQNMEEILPYVDSDTLVVFDVDDTLLAPKQLLGSDPWFMQMLSIYDARGLTKSQAVAKVLPTYMAFQNKTQVRPIEKISAALIHNLQQQNINVIGLTTRSTELCFTTHNQLRSIDIDLKKTALKNHDIDVMTDLPLYYIEGILFTEVRHKGEVLKELCKKLNYEIKKVIFINDKLKYVVQLDETFKELNIPYVGFRYAARDEEISKYDHNISLIEHHYFNKALSNEDALLILKSEEDKL